MSRICDRCCNERCNERYRTAVGNIISCDFYVGGEMNATEEPKPCPFCGSKASMTSVSFPDGDTEYIFQCSCGRKIFEVSSKEKAIRAWNTRTPERGECEFKPFKDEDWSEPGVQ